MNKEELKEHLLQIANDNGYLLELKLISVEEN